MMRICAARICAFDVDDTLVTQEPIKGVKAIPVKAFNQTTLVYPKAEIIQKLKQEFNKKKFIIVWSQQGDEWADAVVRAIGLELFVHLAMGKVDECYDDLPIKEWMVRHKV